MINGVESPGLVENEKQPGQVDFSLHDIVGIRLLDATSSEVAMITRQIGPIQRDLNKEPDITIRFVDALETTSSIRYLGVDDSGFTDDAFLVLRSKHKSKAKVQIPFDQIGQNFEIVCERGLPAVPLLVPIINLIALNNGALPMHASAFSYEGKGILVTGWAKGGKTETLLAFMSKGAEYVGDEWVYISTDGKHMYGIPEPIRVWDWHLEELPEYRSLISRGDRARLMGLNMLTGTLEKAGSNAITGRTSPGKLLRRMNPIVKRQQYVHLPPGKIFSRQIGSLEYSLDMIFFVASHEDSAITVQSIDPKEVAERMVFSLQEERIDFMSSYLKFRFAFPESQNPLIENVEKRQREALLRVLAGKEAYAVYHPYPVSIPALYDEIKPFLTLAGTGP